MKVFRLGLGVFGVAVAAGVLMFGVLGFGTAGAAPGPGGGSGGMRGLGDMQAALAAKLNISVATLQAAQTAARTQVINDAVGAGKLTQAQANALLNGPRAGGTPGTTPGTPGTPGQPKGQKGPKGARPNFTGLMEIMKNYQTVLAQKLDVTPQALQTAQMAARDQLLQDAVTAGKLTQAQADAIKNHQHGQGGLGAGGGGGLGKGIRDAETAAATALGMTPQDLQAQLRSGKSLADIAQSKGIARATLRSGILGAIQTDVNNALRDGKITSTQATDIINKASQNLDKVLDRKFTPRTPGTNQRGPRPNGQQQRPSSGQPSTFVQPKGA